MPDCFDLLVKVAKGGRRKEVATKLREILKLLDAGNPASGREVYKALTQEVEELKKCRYPVFVRALKARRKEIEQLIGSTTGAKAILTVQDVPVGNGGFPPYTPAEILYAAIYEARPHDAHELMYMALESVINKALAGDQEYLALVQRVFTPMYSRRDIEEGAEALRRVLEEAPEDVRRAYEEGASRIRSFIHLTGIHSARVRIGLLGARLETVSPAP